MRVNSPLLRVALCVAVASAFLVGRSLRAQDDVVAMIARIEAPQSPNRQGFDGLTLPQVLQKVRVPGVSIAVIRNFAVHWAKAYGVADVETGRPVRDDTLFQAASISKPVTAMAALGLVQEGRFSLDDDINTLLKSWHVPRSDLTRDRPVTPRSLLSHTSGADDGFGFPGYDPSAARPTVVQILNGEKPSNVGRVVFARPPFQAFKYSGGGFTIMQLALTDLAGEAFAQIMETRVLTPLGMASSSFEQPLPEVLAVRAARAHNAQGQRMDAPWHVYPEQAAAGLWTTPTDLARFAIGVQRALGGASGSVLAQVMAREMITPTGVGPYAVGFTVEKRNEGWYLLHSGSNWGFRCSLLAHARKGYGLVVMTNGDAGAAVNTEIEARVASAYGWDSLDKPLLR
jgi:CubicO group peptidase (beta-lactamase class C family)